MVALMGQDTRDPGELALAFLNKGRRHQAGWGVARHDGQSVTIQKSPTSAHQDAAFLEAARSQSDGTRLWHLRFATRGGLSLPNTHPFRLNHWLFCHNGTLPHHLERWMRDTLKPLTAGETDSEVLMHWLVHHLEGAGGEGLRTAIATLLARAPEARMNFLLTDGRTLYAFRYGHQLFVAHSPRSLVIASHPLFPGFQAVRPGELLRVSSQLALTRQRGWLPSRINSSSS